MKKRRILTCEGLLYENNQSFQKVKTVSANLVTSIFIFGFRDIGIKLNGVSLQVV